MVACVILNRITIVFTTDTFLIRITLVSTTKALLRCVLKCRKMIRKRNGKCLENYLRNMSYKSRNFPKSSDFHIYVLIFPLHKKGKLCMFHLLSNFAYWFYRIDSNNCNVPSDKSLNFHYLPGFHIRQ